MTQPADSPASAPGVGLPDLSTFGAILFDLDGVLTPTAAVHMRAWAKFATAYFAEHGPVSPYTEEDYYQHIDGRPRYDGVQALLASRGFKLPRGTPTDPPGAATICGQGNLKDGIFQRLLQDEGVTPYAGSVKLLDRLDAAGTPTAVVSSSRNAHEVLKAAHLEGRFKVVVDGHVAAREGLAGKPSPATYLWAAKQLGVPADRAVVVEDALTGVGAGRSGGFGLVVGVDRGAGVDELKAAGANVVVPDLEELADVLPAGPDGPA
jgi:HAD superfamily hydrolase (TIGR01509 family)